VALVLSALPPTQVSVERLFSSLKIVESDLHNRIGEKLLNSILSSEPTRTCISEQPRTHIAATEIAS
jgi:hypothetical protein